MKINIDGTWYSTNENKICIIFEDAEIKGLRESTKETMPRNRLIVGQFNGTEDAVEWADKNCQGLQ